MSKGDRCIILAAFGWLSLTAQHPDPEAERKQAEAQQSIANALGNVASTYQEHTKRAEGSKETEPCEQGDDRRYSELCAQWKAADAAADSAWWAWMSGVLGALSLAGVVAALGVGLHSNWIARDTSKRQLRAYLTVAKAEIEGFGEGGVLVYTLRAENSGQTPAHGVTWTNWIKMIELPEKEDDFIEPPGDTPQSNSVVGSGKPLLCTAIWAKLDVGTYDKLMRKEKAVFLFGHIVYQDVFGDKRETQYRFRLDPEIPSVSICEHGNRAT